MIVICVLESGLTGMLSKKDYADKLLECDILTCRIKSIQKNRYRVLLTCRESEMRSKCFERNQNMDLYFYKDWSNVDTEKEKARKKKKLAKKHLKARKIVHPRFRNITTDEAIKEDKMQFLLTNIDFNDSYESVATQEFSRGVDGEAERTETVEEQVAGDTEQMDKHAVDEENVVGLGSVQEDAEVVDEMEGHNFAQGWDAFLQEEEEEENEPIEMAQSRASRVAVLGKSKVSEEKNSEVDAMAQSRGAEKGKGKMAEQDIPFTVDEEDSRSKFDDSSDEDYLESDDSEDDEEGYKELVDEDNYDVDEDLVEEGTATVGGTSDKEDLEGEFSDSPSFILDDIEGASDDNIFLGKNPTKAELLKKLRKFISQSKNQNKNHNQTKTKKKDKSKRSTKWINIREGEGPNQSLHDDWYSDPREEDELLSLDGSDDEIGEKSRPRHHFFREGEWNMKGKSLVVGMKFENFRVYREALRDYSVSNGFDVEYIRNEAKRVTVTCKNENCKWRLHASPIQNTIIFQIKSLKGDHSCAKKFNNKLVKSSYIAKRLEQI
ncbi:hypothetical protein BUALT_Bualt16G0109400 [Buddleja alternifolia]|uniref:Transposase MuDR plant domain-containing protein n=1 Tax=Buddleja alternifolia TaxID=168488 RepID=A0AAV6WG40_9LAMI|nr:hypothetical protein BUALT_Bualt16G0109400 [Buddleja alternifolia]